MENRRALSPTTATAKEKKKKKRSPLTAYKRLPRSLAEEEGAEGEAGRTKRRGTNSATEKIKEGKKGRAEVKGPRW